MRERRKQELDLVAADYGDLELPPDLDWFVIQRLVLPHGWNMDTSQLLILIPPGYPTTPPDNFYADPALRLKGGQQPGSTSTAAQQNRQWLQFSYHADEWYPHADFRRGHNLLSFLFAVRQRLSEVN